jgi:hypothetical protein
MIIDLPRPIARLLHYAAFICAALVLFAYAGPAEAATGVQPGFWTGYGDGLLSLITFLLSPIADVTIFDGSALDWSYDIGYCLGVLTFAGAAGAVASSKDAEIGISQWE